LGLKEPGDPEGFPFLILPGVGTPWLLTVAPPGLLENPVTLLQTLVSLRFAQPLHPQQLSGIPPASGSAFSYS
jgi:hypothetical protein